MPLFTFFIEVTQGFHVHQKLFVKVIPKFKGQLLVLT